MLFTLRYISSTKPFLDFPQPPFLVSSLWKAKAHKNYWDLDKGKKIAATTLRPAENVTKQRAVNFRLTFVYMVALNESIIYNKS